MIIVQLLWHSKPFYHQWAYSIACSNEYSLSLRNGLRPHQKRRTSEGQVVGAKILIVGCYSVRTLPFDRYDSTTSDFELIANLFGCYDCYFIDYALRPKPLTRRNCFTTSCTSYEQQILTLLNQRID